MKNIICSYPVLKVILTTLDRVVCLETATLSNNNLISATHISVFKDQTSKSYDSGFFNYQCNKVNIKEQP